MARSQLTSNAARQAGRAQRAMLAQTLRAARSDAALAVDVEEQVAANSARLDSVEKEVGKAAAAGPKT